MPARSRTPECVPRRFRFRSRFWRRLSRKSLIVLASAVLFVFLIVAWRIRERTQERLGDERARTERQNQIPFEQVSYPPISSTEIECWQGHNATRDLAHFRDSVFVATDGGLIEYGLSGDLRRHYSVLDGLPESDLLSLATFNARLFIGTRSQGLVAFDGEQFVGYRWP